MKTATIKNLQHFVGKICSIILPSINRQFTEEQAQKHFVIRVQEISEDGIWGTDPFNSDIVSFFAMAHIVSILQEVELDPDNPEHAQMLKEFEEKTGKPFEPDLGPNKKAPQPMCAEEPADDSNMFVDIKDLSRLAAQTKAAFDAAKSN
jgi:hypothetical protein